VNYNGSYPPDQVYYITQQPMPDYYVVHMPTRDNNHIRQLPQTQYVVYETPRDV